MGRIVRTGRHIGRGDVTTTTTDGSDLDGSDLIGEVSAALVTSCPERADRLAALSLFGLLLDRADERGRVRMPLQDLAGELGVDPEEAVHLLHQLVHSGAVWADGDAVVVAGTPAASTGALRPSRFLANVASVLDTEPAGASGSPYPPDHRAATPSPIAPRRQRRRALASLVVGAAAMVLATVPSDEASTSLQTLASSPATGGRAAWADDGAVPGVTAASIPEDQPTPSPATSDDAASVVPPAPGPRVIDEPASPVPTTAAPSRRPLVPPVTEPPARRSAEEVDPAPAAVPGSSAVAPEGPVGDEPPITASPLCPATTLPVEVLGVRDLATGPLGLLDLGGERLVEITGTVRNHTPGSITAIRLGVGTGGGEERTIQQATTIPATLASGATARWTVNVRTALRITLTGEVDVDVLSWSWSDPDIPACPS